MSPACSQCGEEGCSVHGRCAGGQSRQSTGEPAGQWRYSLQQNVSLLFCDENLVSECEAGFERRLYCDNCFLDQLI